MKLLMVIHRDDSELERFLSAVRAENLAGFTLMRSSGVGRTSQKIPLEFGMGGLMGLLTGESDKSTRLENTTALSLVHDERLPRVLELLNQHCTDVGKPGGGLYAVLNVSDYGGLE
jgi:nitrogen regulatory protein PII